jgi:hypothetical protein
VKKAYSDFLYIAIKKHCCFFFNKIIFRRFLLMKDLKDDYSDLETTYDPDVFKHVEKLPEIYNSLTEEDVNDKFE